MPTTALQMPRAVPPAGVLISIPFEPQDSLSEVLQKLSDCAQMIEGTTRPVPQAVIEALMDGLLSAVVHASALSDGPGNSDLLDAVNAWLEERGRF